MFLKRVRRYAAIASLLALAVTAAPKQKTLKPGFNLFSKDQDIQMGREYAAQIEREMEVVNNPELNNWLQKLGEKLARAPEADKYPYTFKIVHEGSINAFALPGGPTFTHTGLIAQADNEAQVAGVLGHEIAHVALRHGTNQASKAQLLQLPALLGGAMAGGGGGITGTLAQLGIGLGANGLLMKFSRNAESDADLLGTRILHQAGYNPIELARFFEKLQAESGGKGNFVTAFMSSHPDPGNRKKRIEEEIRFLPAKQYTDSGDFARIQRMVKAMPAPQKKPAQGGGGLPQSKGGRIEEARPAGGFKSFQAQGLSMQHPSNWEVFGQQGSDITIAPRSGVFTQQNGQNAIGYGVVIGQAKSQSGDFARDTQALIQQFIQGNQGMRVTGDTRQQTVDGKAAYLTLLTSSSPWGGNEADWLVTVQVNGGLVYFVFIAPEQDLNNARPAFEQMISSVRLGR